MVLRDTSVISSLCYRMVWIELGPWPMLTLTILPQSFKNAAHIPVQSLDRASQEQTCIDWTGLSPRSSIAELLKIFYSKSQAKITGGSFYF